MPLVTVKIPENTLPSIVQAIKEICDFDAVHQITDIVSSDNESIVTVQWVVQLPNAFKQQRLSGTGVRDIEEIRWTIQSDYPLRAPRPWLRDDFPQNLPHINPRKPGSAVSPCIAEMSLDELLHSNGLNSILSAMGQWLDKAATNELHCPVQGWEVVRRTDSEREVLADTHAIRDELNKNNRSVRFFKAKYIIHKNYDGPALGAFVTPSLGSDNKSYQNKDCYVFDPRGLRSLHTPCVMFQTKPKSVFDEYQPETVYDFGSLREFANYLGLKEAFEKRIQYLSSIISPDVKREENKEPIEAFLVIFAVKRPYNLIGLDSSWELLSYWVRFSMLPDKKPLPDNAVVSPVQLVERCGTHLLQSVSGHNVDKPHRVAALGCGSLGSKIVLHLGKNGRYQFDLIDNAVFKSHNNARHGLVVRGFDPLSVSKALLLERELAHLNVKAKVNWKDICSLNQENGYTLNKGVEYLIDSTAALKVRYFLSHQCAKLPGQLIHTVMFAKASMGVVAIEGKDRSVRVDDLMAHLNSMCIQSELYQRALYGNEGPKLQHYGEGCSSVTTTMSDIDISLMSSAIASKIDTHISSTTQLESGVLHVGVLDKDTLNLTWEKHDLSPTLIIPREEHFPWEIRVLNTVTEQIKSLSLKDISVENGGVIAGQVCALSRTIYVTTLMDAPNGSLRSQTKFDLSTAGLKSEFESIHKKTNGQITFLGTWHSHTSPVPPSEKDKTTLRQLQSSYDLPIVMLTYTGGHIVRV